MLTRQVKEQHDRMGKIKQLGSILDGEIDEKTESMMKSVSSSN